MGDKQADSATAGTDPAGLPYRPCVGVVLVNSLGRVFAGQRIDSDFDAWQMPQGGIEPDEKPGVAALRELQEETGIRPDLVELVAESSDWLEYDLPADLVPKLWGARFRGQKQKWFLFRFLGRDGDIRIETEHPEFSAWDWLSPDEVLRNVVPFKAGVYRHVLDEFKDLI